MLVQDLMTSQVATVDADMTIAEAAVMMRDLDVGALPVVKSSDDKSVVGILTDRDIVIRAVAGGFDCSKNKVGEILTTGVICCKSSDPLDRAIQLMEEKKVRRIVVVEDDGSATGILSVGDIARHAADYRLPAELIEQVSSD